MMAGSTKRSNQRPDTLMQDRIRRIDETSCTARPDHTRWVKSGKPQIEHMFSALPPIGDILDTTDTHRALPARGGAFAGKFVDADRLALGAQPSA